jgi:hypothetical protein
MTNITPLEPLLRRLAETPDEFLGEPKIGHAGDIHVAALVHDVLFSLNHRPDAALLDRFGLLAEPKQRNAQKLAMILVWLLADPCFTNMTLNGAALGDLFITLVPAMSQLGRADRYVNDAERREELIRVVLAQLNCLPQGETAAQSEDRLTRISGGERMRLIMASRAAEARAKEVREALARKAAQESADKWTRE